MTDKTQTTTTTPSDEATLIFTRVFDAPRELVFKAWTDPEHLKVWWGPHGFTNPVVEVDARPGGTWRIDMQGPDGTIYPNKGVYLEIVEPERIVYTDVVDESNAGAWGDNPPPSSVTTITFEDQGGKTKFTSVTRYETIAERDANVEMGVEEGFNQMMERLVAHLTTL